MSEPLICENERHMQPILGPVIHVTRQLHAGASTSTHVLIVCSWKCAAMAAEQCGLATADEGPDWLLAGPS